MTPRAILLFSMMALGAFPLFAQVQFEDCLRETFPRFRDDVPEDWNSQVFVVAPANNATDLPLNVQFRFEGFFFDIDAGFQTLSLRNMSNNEVVETDFRDQTLVPVENLSPNTTYGLFARYEFEENDNGGYMFTTGTTVDDTAPVLENLPFAHVFLHGDCGGGSTSSLAYGIDAAALDSDVVRLQASVALDQNPSELVGDVTVELARFFSQRGFGNTALSEFQEVRVSVAPIDLAGNVGAAQVFRTRARRQSDAPELDYFTYRDLDDYTCTLDREIEVSESVPKNGFVVVRHAFEAVPYRLVSDDEEIALFVEDTFARGQILRPASSVQENVDYRLELGECEACVCPTCSSGEKSVRFVGDDNEAPANISVLSIEEDLEPDFATDVCVPDSTSLIVNFDAIEDATPARDLRFNVSLRVDGFVPVDVGQELRAQENSDGSLSLRLESELYGRLLPLDFELEIDVVDLAQNATRLVYRHGEAVEESGGCSQYTSHFTLWSFALVLLFVTRRRRT